MRRRSVFIEVPEEDKFELGNRIREKLDERGLSQNELAFIIEADPSTVSQWCTGISKPGYKSIKALALALDVTTDYLLGMEEVRHETV